MRYAASADVLAAHLDGEAVLLHMESKDYFRLNDTAAWVWKGLERGLDVDAIVASLTERYEVAPQSARGEVEALLQELEERALVLRVPAA